MKKPNSKQKIKFLIASALCCAALARFGSPAVASILVHESFDYPAGDLAEKNGGTGWAGPWIVGTNSSAVSATVVDTGLEPPAMSYAVPGGGIVQGGNKGLDMVTTGLSGTDRYVFASREFSPPLTQTFYVGYFLHLKAGSAFPHSSSEAFGSFFSATSPGTENGPNGPNFGPQGSVDNWINRERGSGGTPVHVKKAGTTAAGATNYVVAKFTWDGSKYTKCDLWVNPAFTSVNAPDSTHAMELETYPNFTWFYLRGVAPVTDAFRVDELTIGTAWEDVVKPQAGVVPPVIVINQPTNGAVFADAANVNLTVTATDADGSVVKVEYFAGTNKIGEATSSPFSFLWSNPTVGRYQITAVATDNAGATGVSAAVNVKVGTLLPQILMVAGTNPGNAAELAIKSRLESYGFTVEMLLSASPLPAFMSDYALIIVSSTVGSGDITKFRDVAVPLINWEWLAFDGLGMTDDESFSLTGQTDVDIVNASHPIAAGLPAGPASIFASASPQMAAGFPVVSATTIANAVDGSGAAALFALEKGAALSANAGAGLVAPERRVGIFLGGDTFSLLNAYGLRLFDASVAWALHRPTLGVRPTVVITQPTAAATFPAGANVALVVNAADPDGSVIKVEYFSGSVKIGEATSSPFGFTWTNVSTGRYAIIARATDNSGIIGDSAAVTFNVGTPTPQALFLVADVRGTASESAIRTRLESFGFNVQMLAAANAIPADAANQDLILASSTVATADAAKYRDVPVALINWKAQAYDDLGMTDSEAVAITGQTTVEILNSSHPMAAGLPAGITTIFTSASAQMAAGYPVSSASIIANAADGSGASVLFGIDKGAALSAVTASGLTAAARRVGIFFGGEDLFTGGDTFLLLNPTGLKLFDAALAWSLNRATMGQPPVVSMAQPANGATFEGGANIILTANPSDPDGTIAKVEFFADTNKVGEATSGPFQVTWANAQPGVYRLTAKATDNSGSSAVSTAVSITVGSSIPTVLFLVGNPAELNASDAGMKARLESYGFKVQTVDDGASVTSDSVSKVLVLISGTVNSGNVSTKFRDVTVPVVNMEEAADDEFRMTLDSPADHASIGGQTTLMIVDATHPMAAGLGEGEVTIATAGTLFAWGIPSPTSGKVIATMSTGEPCTFVYDKGEILIDGTTPAPARRVHLFIKDGFAVLNDAGLKLFDASISWGINQPLVQSRPKFNPAILQNGNLVISWTGSGTLQQANNPAGNWTDAPSQGNPQSVPTTEPMRFYRVRR